VRILVVDDEPSVRDALDRALRMDGYRVELAADGTQALDALAHTPPDAIVLDVLMPGPDGLEVCRRLRAAGDRTPVLMLTARDTVPDRVLGLDAGADDYLVKPFALEELGARLRALLRHPRQVLTRTQIFEHVWGYDFGPSSNSLEVYVGYLRRKLEAGGEPRVLHTVRGVGYVLRER
jgi:two-component system response regulator MprA